MANYKTIGLFGGTFDPVHIGHLRIALELKQQLNLDEMRLVPCHKPPHREQPVASAKHRAAMVMAAIQNCSELTIETCELENHDPSYSFKTLKYLRGMLGENVSLCLAVGMDSLISLPSWHRWKDILKLAHIVVAARPGFDSPSSGEIGEYILEHKKSDSALIEKTHGSIVIKQLSLLPVSSTDIRARLAENLSPQFLLPDTVFKYLQEHQLYKTK
ncbi:MAG: nicotinate-nucleotide adenylyltransferase [Cellvibrionaceae bacterium]